MVGDRLVEDKKEIEEHIINHFKQQFVEPLGPRPTLQGLIFNQVFDSPNDGTQGHLLPLK